MDILVPENVQRAETRAWWEKRRRAYNLALVAAGIAAFAVYVVVIARAPTGFHTSTGEPPEITLFTMAFQGAGYLFAMALANVLYLLGPLSERIVRPRNPPAWRRAMFALGLGFSVALPFGVPLAAYLTLVRPR